MTHSHIEFATQPIVNAKESLNLVIGEFRLIDRLSDGRMGHVYRAIHINSGKIVAAKILTTVQQNPRLVARFFNEARIQSRLHHRNIVALHDFFEFESMLCIVMEYVDGPTLNDLIKSRGCIPPSYAMRILTSVVEAIAYIHEHGIIHRDLKPENIKISRQKEVKLIDFGIAQTDFSPKVTVVGNVIGTTHYLSPERIKGKPANVKSDIWALGVLMYEITTGCTPFDAFEGELLNDLYEKIITKPYPLPSTINPDITKGMELIIARCLQKKPSNRYQTAEKMLNDIKNIESKFRRTAPKRIRPKQKTQAFVKTHRF